MSKHHNSKTDTNGSSAPGQTPSAEDHDGDGETARLAYSYWQARCGTHGSAEEDWLRAEQEMKALRL
jgi:hypothetical protein